MATTELAARRGRLQPALLADLAVLAVALVWGASYPVARGALAHAPVLVLLVCRFAITAGLMTAIARRELAGASAGDRLRGVVLGGILSCIFLAETWGLALTSATNAALIISLSAIFTAVLDYGLSRRLPPTGVLAGAGVACLGVGLLTGGLDALSAGDLLILLAAGLRAVMVVSTRRLMAGRTLSSAALTALQSMTVTAVMATLLLAGEGPAGFVLPGGVGFWGAVAFLSLFCTVAAFYVQNAAVRRTSPTRVSLLMGTEPLFGVGLSVLLLGEPLTGASIAGAALIIAGVLAGTMAEARRGA